MLLEVLQEVTARLMQRGWGKVGHSRPIDQQADQHLVNNLKGRQCSDTNVTAIV